MSNELRNFLALSYEELEELNLKAKKQRMDRVATHKIQEERIKYLTNEKRIKEMLQEQLFDCWRVLSASHKVCLLHSSDSDLTSLVA